MALATKPQGKKKLRLEQERQTSFQWLKAGFNYNLRFNYSTNPKVTIGSMDNVCRFCHARKWPGETAGMCCTADKVRLETLQPPPNILMTLLTDDTPKSKHFRSNIWKYNAAFMMTS